MAEVIVSGVVEKLADLLLKQAKEEIDLLTGIETEVLNLIGTLKMIGSVLGDAEQRKITDETCKAWLEDLEDLAYDIDDVLDEWSYMILRQEIESSSPSVRKQPVCSFNPSSCFCFKQVVVHRDIATKVKELSERLDLIEKRKNQFSFNSSIGGASNSQERKRVQSTSFIEVSEVFGRASDKDTLVKHLLSETTQEEKVATKILSIIGMGGIGKTTLAQLAYNDDQVMRHFQKRGWICVANRFDEIRIASAILECLESRSPNLYELQPLLQQIRDSTFGKRFLLVLDDVWLDNGIEWEPLINSLMHGAPGSILLLTTRSESVARAVGATCTIHLGALSDSDSWSLFRHIVFSGRPQMEFGMLEDIGMKIARKCRGLPLAIETIGGLLRFKNSIQEWKHVMHSELWELEAAEVEIFSHLYLSYNDLSPPLRRCFAYCAILPRDVGIDVDDLIRMWMAQGYLHFSGDEEMEDAGRECIESLALRSFIQDIKFHEYYMSILSCKMSGIMHDFARFLTRGECLTISGKRTVEFCENARHLTLLGREATDFLPSCKLGHLRSFLAKNLKLETLTDHLINNLKLVRVLKLDGCGLKELSKDVRNLINLRYLGLSNNEELKELPNTVYDLYNLQTLNIEGCPYLLELSSGIEKLKKLRHFIHSVDNMKFPEGIKELTFLQTLSHFPVGSGRNKLGYLKNLNQLRGSLCINILDNLDDTSDAEVANLRFKSYIQELTFKLWGNVTIDITGRSIRGKEDVLEALKPHPNLQCLSVYSYASSRTTSLPTWLRYLSNLRQLTFSGCSELTTLPPLVLPSLEKLQIINFPQLKFVGPAFLGITESSLSPAIGFPRLTELHFEFCNEWEEWEDIVPEDDIVPLLFPRLRQLKINKCRKLKALPYHLLRMASMLECIELDEKEYDPSTILSTDLTLAGKKRSIEEEPSAYIPFRPQYWAPIIPGTD